MSDDSLALLSLKTVALICPVCLEQLEPDEDSDGRHFHYGTSVEPIEVDTYPYLAELKSKRDLALFRLQTDIRDHAFKVGEERWYGNLSVEDRFWEDQRREKARRERRARMSKVELALTQMVEWQVEDLERHLKRPHPILDFVPRGPKPDALDTWLASEDPLPEIEAALL